MWFDTDWRNPRTSEYFAQLKLVPNEVHAFAAAAGRCARNRSLRMLISRPHDFANAVISGLPPILAWVVVLSLAGINHANASDDRKFIKSITHAGHTIDRAHSIAWQDWRIGFGRRRPFAEFSEQGMTLRGLSCARAKVSAMKCRLFMSMKPLESFPHFCELSPDGHRASATWSARIDCPNVIGFYH
jgi:hypothetical protein